MAASAPAGGPGNGGRLVLANQHVRLGVRPGLGAKVDSLAYRPTGREWLITCRVPPSVRSRSAKPASTADWAKLRDPNESWLRMSWDRERLPCLAVWLEHGRYSPAVVCPEPMTGYYEDLGRGCRHSKVLVVPPGRPAEWSIRMTFGRSWPRWDRLSPAGQIGDAHRRRDRADHR